MSFLNKLYNSCWDLYKIVRYVKKFNYSHVQTEKKSLILGGGPSLLSDIKDTEIDKYNVFVLNSFVNHPLFIKIKPGNYVIADPAFWLEGERFTRFSDLKLMLVTALSKDVTWKMNFWIPDFARNASWLGAVQANKNVQICYYNLVDFNGFEFLRFKLYDLALGAPKAQTVLIQAIFNSIWMGSKEIYLAGADHNWLNNIYVGKDNRVYLADNHYDKAEKRIYEPWLNYRGDYYNVHTLLVDLSRMFSGYHEIRRYCDVRDIKVVNLTRDSYIDAFDRLS